MSRQAAGTKILCYHDFDQGGKIIYSYKIMKGNIPLAGMYQ